MGHWEWFCFATRELYYKFIQHYGPINANDEDAIKEMRFICHRIDESEYTAEESIMRAY